MANAMFTSIYREQILFYLQSKYLLWNLPGRSLIQISSTMIKSMMTRVNNTFKQFYETIKRTYQLYKFELASRFNIETCSMHIFGHNDKMWCVYLRPMAFKQKIVNIV